MTFRYFMKYELEKEIGAGAMGRVYRARHTALGRVVAFKVLRPELTAGWPAERFDREKALLCRLNHPAVVKILDAGMGDHSAYLVMEYLEGATLAHLIANRPEEARARAEDLLGQVLDALSYCHGLGIIHRDVKPENLMLSEHGTVKLVDFGLAVRDSLDRTILTCTDAVIGTPTFLPPERLLGEETSPTTDVWSAGCTYYALLAGQPPFLATRYDELYQQVLNAAPAPLPRDEPA